MRLISCHIENFGKLHNFDYNFDSNLSIIKHDNGWGKSTLVSFLLVMLYGFEGERARKGLTNERKNYTPWQGGTYGGSLTFEYHGKEYVLTRVFGSKKNNDTFDLRDRDTNLLSSDFTSEIGQELFNVDRNSFLRSCFIAQNNTVTEVTDDINAKISNLTDDTNDINNYESSLQALNDKINSLNPERKTGEIYKLSNDIYTYQQEINNRETLDDTLASYITELEKAKAEGARLRNTLEKKNAELKESSEFQSVISKKEHWESLKADVSSKQQLVNQAKSKLPGKIPSIEKINEHIESCSQADRYVGVMDANQFSPAESQRYAMLNSQFNGKTPSNEDFQIIADDAAYYERVQSNSTAKLTAIENERLRKLDPIYSAENKQYATIFADWNHRNSLLASLPANEATLRSIKATQNAKATSARNIKMLLMVIALFLLLAGIIILIVPKNIIPGIMLTAIGVFLLIASFVVSPKANDDNKSELATLEEVISNIQHEIAQIEVQTKHYVNSHQKYYDVNSVSFTLQEIYTEYIEYTNLLTRKQSETKVLSDPRFDRVQASLDTFFKKYRLQAEPSYSAAIEQFKSLCNDYKALINKRSEYLTAQQNYNNQILPITNYIHELGFSPEEYSSLQKCLVTIRDLTDEYLDAKTALQESLNNQAVFENTNNMKLLANQSIPDIQSPTTLAEVIQTLNNALEDNQNTISFYEQKVQDILEQIDEREEKRKLLDTLIDERNHAEKTYQIACLTRDKLSQAKASMTSQYSAPILSYFQKYYESITNESSTDFKIDANTKISLQCNGIQRDTELLSCGNQDLIGFCLRLAFVKAMYPAEKPILIMDDPFTNLDDHRATYALSLVEKLSTDYQIIYMTCSESRV